MTLADRLKDLVMGPELCARLSDATQSWHTLDVLYEEPRVERVWTQLDAGTRLNLHVIYPCEKPFLHPHPWPSAVLLVTGRQRMNVGYGMPDGSPPHSAAVIELAPGSLYSMEDPCGWHDVNPIGLPSLSIMLTGRPWQWRDFPPLSEEARAKNRPIGNARRDWIKNAFLDQTERIQELVSGVPSWRRHYPPYAKE